MNRILRIALAAALLTGLTLTLPGLTLTLPTAGAAEKAAKAEKKSKKARDRDDEPAPPAAPLPAEAAHPSPPLKLTPTQVAAAAAKIDALVAAGLTKAKQSPNPPTTDEQFVRRAYLDIAGRIPTAEETIAFLSDRSADKRATLIDRLLLSFGYRSQQFNWLAEMLRVTDGRVTRGQSFVYQDWLKEQTAKNRPWDGLVYDLMTAEGRLVNTGPTGWLLRDRGMPLDSLSNTLTTFLGANVACAQCHNHPSAVWTQRDFYEMAAFFGATDFADRDPRKLAKRLADEKFDKQSLVRLIAPNMIVVKTLSKNGLTLPEDYKYDDAKPNSAVLPRLIQWSPSDAANPAYRLNLDPKKPENWRAAFARWLTHPSNPRFAVAIANRLWREAFGLAVLEPVTDLDDLGGASNRPLLEHLAAEMVRLKFDLREFQRILFNTRSYQRQASPTPDPAAGPYQFPGPVTRRLSAEQAWDSVLTLVIGTELDRYRRDNADDIRRYDLFGDKEVNASTVMEVAKKLGEEPKRSRRGKTDDYAGGTPHRHGTLVLVRASELPQPTPESHFLRMFGQSDRGVADGSSREGGIPQVLMLLNGPVGEMLAGRDSVVLRHASAKPTAPEQITALYLSFLSRPPTRREMTIAANALRGGLELSDLTWVLFNTREFLFVP